MQMTPDVQAAEDRPTYSKMANRRKGKQAYKLITSLSKPVHRLVFSHDLATGRVW